MIKDYYINKNLHNEAWNVILWNISDVYMLIHLLIRYSLLVLGWAPVCHHSCFNSSWYNFKKVLSIFLRLWSILTRQHQTVAVDFSAAHPWWSPVQPNPNSLRSGDWGGQLSAVNSLSYSKKHFKWCSVGNKRPKYWRENIPTLLHYQQAELLIQVRMDLSFHIV